MFRVHDFILSPFGRKLRLALAEKHLGFAVVPLRPWEGAIPVEELTRLELPDGTVMTDAGACAEYIDEIEPEPRLMPASPLARAQARRWSNWLDGPLWRSVTDIVLQERVLARHGRAVTGGPEALKASLAVLRTCLAQVEQQVEREGSLVDATTIADLSLAAHLSCLDYFGDVPWQACPATREWYARIKSRPSFRPLLNETLPGFAPVAHYADLDF
ncbi:MAG: glutathione S-transferase family protein [Alphaproteobacteria bacterium]|nr:glutathione S-transferase family protein [Alphaproteobacteria bacterium]